jgi:hypothetical protein
MIGVINQPTYLPWIGYFEMISHADVFVVFDHVQFERKSWQQRNKVKTAQGPLWLTVPVQHTERDVTRICDVKISFDHGNPLQQHWATICHSYKKAPCFNEFAPIFQKVFERKHELLRDLNLDLIKAVLSVLGLKPKILCSSDFGFRDQQLGKTERVINTCKKASIDCLYDGESARGFLDLGLFAKEKISVLFQQYYHPAYSQMYPPFVPFLSAIDLIFNEGSKALDIIKQGGNYGQ